MATLWDTVTGNSTLSVGSGNTFWDHLNNQQIGTGGPSVILEAGVEQQVINVEVSLNSIDVEVDQLNLGC